MAFGKHLSLLLEILGLKPLMGGVLTRNGKPDSKEQGQGLAALFEMCSWNGADFQEAFN